MALSAADVYHLTADELRRECVEQGLESSGPVRTLRNRLAEHIHSNKMQASGDDKMAQASAQTNLETNVSQTVFQKTRCCSHDSSADSQMAVFVQLLRQVTPLKSEGPEDLLYIFLSDSKRYISWA
jgi:hypothetical protein